MIQAFPCGYNESGFDERQEVGVYLLRMRGRHSVRQPWIRFKRSVLQKLDRLCARGGERADLIVLAMHHEYWNIDYRQIVIKLGFRQYLDAVILGFNAA